MFVEKLLLFIILKKALCYHFYNPETNQILTRPSLDNLPAGFKLLLPPKSYREKSKSQQKTGYCTDAGFTCNAPFEKALTFQYECDEDYQCPKYYKCCPQRCFQHRICSGASIPQNGPNGSSNSNSNSVRPGNCEKWPYNCQRPYDYSFTSVFRCDNDKQCPRSYKCCQQNCFLHKICSRAITSVKPSGRETTVQEQSTTEANLTPETEDEEEEIEAEVVAEISETTTEESTTEEATTMEVTTEETTTETDVQTTTEGGTTLKRGTLPPIKFTPDPNAIIPEYSEYYYHYDDRNDTETNNDEYNTYDEEEEDEYEA